MSASNPSQDVTNLIKIWIDMMRPVMHHTLHPRCEQFAPTLEYYNRMQEIEIDIARKMKISVEEVKIMLCCKKEMKELKEKNYLKINNMFYKIGILKETRVISSHFSSDFCPDLH